MAVIQFGHTWWGEKWLESLTSIDYTNRLPRGQRYARNGSVVSIDIQKGNTSAKVAGRRRTPYNVHLHPWSFTEEGKKLVKDLILRNPYYLSQLEGRILPRELLEEFSKLEMPLFPSSWKELPMRCSCPDWAVPCKHIAAVIYIIANEIDKDPFLVFKLHGFDLVKSMQEVLYPDQSSAEKVPLLPSLFSEEELNCSCSQSALESIDFSSIPDMGDAAAGILTEKPLFYPKKDFKTLVTAGTEKLSRMTRKKIKEIELVEEPPELLFTSGEFKILTGKKLLSGVLKQGKQRLTFSSEDPEPFISSIGKLPAVNLSAYPPLTAYLVMLHSFTLKLMEQRALIPDLYGVSEGKYRIRWIPALFNAEISAIFTSLAEQLPSSLVSFKGTPLSRREQLFMIISFIAGSYINESYILLESNTDPVTSMFFSGSIYAPARFEERGNIQVMQLWLGRYFTRPSNLVPILHIEEIQHPGKNKGAQKEAHKRDSHHSYRFEIHVENTASADASAAGNAELDEAASGGAASDGAAAAKQSAQKKLTPSTAAGTASSSASASPQPLFSIISELDAESMALLRDLQLLAAYLPAVNTYLKAGKAVTIDEESFAESWFDALGALQTLRVRTHVPKALQKRLFPQLTLSFKKKAGVSSESVTNYLSLQKLVDFQWSVAAGDMLIPADEFYELTSTYKKLIRYHDAYVMLDEKELKKMRKALEKPVSLRPLDIVKIHLEGSFNNVPIQTDASLKSIINSLFTVDPVPLPDRLQADLRPYQEKGFQWLYHNRRIGIGSLIADDMGLGKTLQVLALLQKMKEEGSLTPKKAAIVIVPASIASNWQKEMEKFTPDLVPGIYHGQNRMLDPECEVIITTYSVVSQDTSLLSKKKWSAVIIDEAQNIKTPTAARTAAVKSLKGEVKIAMTGTPVENRLMDYWSVFDFMMKNLLGKKTHFKDAYALPIERYRDRKALESFRKLSSPFILRRMKTDKKIIQDLPDKVTLNTYTELSADQAALYESLVSSIEEMTDQAEGIRRSGMIFKLITGLKQICDHPALYLKQDLKQDVKQNVKQEVKQNLNQAQDIKQDMNQPLRPEMRQGINQEVHSSRLSGKAQQLLLLVEKILSRNEKVLVFTQFAQMGRILQTILEKELSIAAPFFYGALSRKKRDEMVSAFQQDSGSSVMIISLKAGGVGLNLTAANHVIHYDLWWNPAVEHQATDRVFRIGQRKDVQVHRFITKGTFEEKINSMLEEKQELADLTVAQGEKWIASMNNRELKELLKLER